MADLPELLDIADEVGAPSTQHDDEKGDHESGSDTDDALETASDAAAEAEDSDDELAEDECKCLLCAQQLPSARAVFQHCAYDHQFDFYALRRKHGLDFYASLAALNFLRAQPAESSAADRLALLSAELAAHDAGDAGSALRNGKYLQPADASDPILFSFDDDENDDDNSADDIDRIAASPASSASAAVSAAASSAATSVADRHQAEVAALRAQIAQMTEVMHRVALGGTLQARAISSAVEEDGDSDAAVASPLPASASATASDAAASKRSSGPKTARSKAAFASPSTPGVKQRDQGYFDGYSDMAIHDEMLRDTVRTYAYRDFMYANRALFAGKVVLDIGCGTGILSLFAAEAGARRVIGIDRARIIDNAERIVRANGKEGVITLVKGRVEELGSLPEPQVDIIVSEWMGYLLLYESMLSTVLYARDRWLAPGGCVHPSRARLLCSGLDVDAWRAPQREFWRNVYGFDFSSMLHPWPLAVVGDTIEPVVECIDAAAVCTNEAVLRDIDIMTVTDAALDFCADFRLEFARAAAFGALVLYFDTTFAAGCVAPPIVLDTSPAGTPTHWKQTLLFLKETHTVRAGDVVAGTVRLTRPVANPRGYDVVVNLRVNGGAEVVQMFEMQ